MNKRKGSFYDQQLKVTQIINNVEQPYVEEIINGDIQSQIHPNFPQHHYKINQNQYQYEQIQKSHLNNFINSNEYKNGKKDKNNFDQYNSAQKQNKQKRAHSAQRSSSLDKRRQEVIYTKNQYFLENIPLEQYNHQNNYIDSTNELQKEMENQIYQQRKQQMLYKIKRREQYNHSAYLQLKIDELHHNCMLEKDDNPQVQESLVNQLENSTHYQDDGFEFSPPFPIDRNDFLDEQVYSNLANNQHLRCQYRKSFQQSKKPIIQKQTDTTDDHNKSINPNNKSSSDEAIQNDQSGNDSLSGSYIASNFFQKNKQNFNAQPQRDLSTSHDTTKLIDDESANKQQNSDKNAKQLAENNSHSKYQYQGFLSETQIPPTKNQFSQTHPTTNPKLIQFIPTQIRSNSTHKQETKRINTPSRESSSKQVKKNLSIISDQYEDILEVKALDHQFCPKQSETGLNKHLYQRNPNKPKQRSKSESKNSRIN